MSLKVVTGKPGAGKTYHVVSQLVLEVRDWLEHHKREGPFARVLYTNLPLNLDAWEAHYEGQGKYGFDAAVYGHYIRPLDLALPGGDVQDGEKVRAREWFDVIPDGALIVIDEVHEHLGAELDYGARLTAFRNYVATHRHRGHDLLLITQHIENVSLEILRIAEEIIDVQNLKAGRIPVLGIPLADIDVVRRAWGSEVQVYRASMGRVVGRAIKWGEDCQTHFITPELFALYNSHNKGDGSVGKGDRPTVRLGRVESLWWFGRRHAPRLLVQACLVGVVLCVMFAVVVKAPGLLQKLVRVGGGQGSAMKVIPRAEDGAVEGPRQHTVLKPAVAPPVGASPAGERVRPDLDVAADRIKMLEAEVARLTEIVANCQRGSRAAAVYSGGVLLADGSAVRIGDQVDPGTGERVELLDVDPATGRVTWSTGVEWVR